IVQLCAYQLTFSLLAIDLRHRDALLFLQFPSRHVSNRPENSRGKQNQRKRDQYLKPDCLKELWLDGEAHRNRFRFGAVTFRSHFESIFSRCESGKVCDPSRSRRSPLAAESFESVIEFNLRRLSKIDASVSYFKIVNSGRKLYPIVLKIIHASISQRLNVNAEVVTVFINKICVNNSHSTRGW